MDGGPGDFRPTSSRRGVGIPPASAGALTHPGGDGVTKVTVELP